MPSDGRAGRSRLLGILLVAALGLAAYTAYVTGALYVHLRGGGDALLSAQSDLSAGLRTGDAAAIRSAQSELRTARDDFTAARAGSNQDPAFRLLGQVPTARDQIAASAHLAAIGEDLSRAGDSVAAIALQIARLKQTYGGRTLTLDDLQSLLRDAEAVARQYSASARSIGDDLRAAHRERSQVVTTHLVPQLRRAYDRVDEALRQADQAFMRFQDVSLILSQFLGIPIPG